MHTIECCIPPCSSPSLPSAACPSSRQAGCRRPCSNRVADVRCCDSIFLPSLYFHNADSFPEDREIGYSIDTTLNGAVVWETTVHGLFYQVRRGCQHIGWLASVAFC